MPELRIQIVGHEPIVHKLQGFTFGLRDNYRRGMTKAGALLEADMKRKLSGPSHVDYPGNANPFPGVRRGRLRASVNFQVQVDATGATLKVGPNVLYAPYLELGTSRMEPYPFVGPTFDDKGERAVEMIQDEVIKPLDR